MPKIKLLVVTRENQFDKRYGLAKSLTPILDELSQSNVDIFYLSQTELTDKNEKLLRKFHKILNIVLKLWPKAWIKTNLYTLSWGIIERLNMGRLAAKIAKQQHYTHVHAHDPLIAAGLQLFSSSLCKKKQHQSSCIKQGVTQHGFGSYTQALHEDGVELGTWVMKRMRNWESRILKRADWVVSPTELGLHQLARDLCCYPIPSHWLTIPHPKYPLSNLSREQARKQLAWQDDCLHIISIGRHATLKDFPTLIQACAHIKSDRLWHLTILGDGDWENTRQFAKSMGLAPSQLTLHASDDISPWYAGADLYVSTSVTESFGMANHEAICAGLPCILTAVAAVPEAARNAASYIPPREVDTLTQALERFINSDLERVLLAQCAAVYAKHWPTSKSLAEAYLACYQGQHPAKILPQNSNHRLPQLNTDHWSYLLQQFSLFRKPKALSIADNSRILVFAPHPDDETFTMAGTLLALKAKGCEISVILMTTPKKESEESRKEETPRRIKEFQAALKYYGIKTSAYLDQADGDYKNNTPVREKIRKLIEKIQPQTIFAPPVLDIHNDHLQASLSILQTWSEMHYPTQFYFYESWQPLPATHYVDISAYTAQKKEAIALYQTPLQHFDYQKISQLLQAYRISIMANQSTAAEAFMHIDPHKAHTIVNACIQLRSIMH